MIWVVLGIFTGQVVYLLIEADLREKLFEDAKEISLTSETFIKQEAVNKALNRHDYIGLWSTEHFIFMFLGYILPLGGIWYYILGGYIYMKTNMALSLLATLFLCFADIQMVWKISGAVVLYVLPFLYHWILEQQYQRIYKNLERHL